VTAFDQFRAAADALRPRAAVVLGSGLAGVAEAFATNAVVNYADVPELVPPSVAGHRGQLAVGTWSGVPALVCFGRVHFYEGHSWNRVTRLVRLVAELGVKTLILTNAAGGIHPALGPGSVMAIRRHIKLLDRDAWRQLSDMSEGVIYSPRLLALVQQLDPAPIIGTYAALTGPCYETPAEIRVLAALGANAVGMSTAREAEAAVALRLEVAGISCVTNKAAGLSDGPLNHAEVEANARLAVGRLGTVIGRLLGECGPAPGF
jgi:purine-nucleoside phosphorylase